jgi:hypothetical protein
MDLNAVIYIDLLLALEEVWKALSGKLGDIIELEMIETVRHDLSYPSTAVTVHT